MDFGVLGGSWNQSPVDTEGRLQFTIKHGKIYLFFETLNHLVVTSIHKFYKAVIIM